MLYAVIVNPVAGNGKGKKVYEKIRQSTYLRDKTAYYVTEYKGHIAQIIPKIEKEHPNVTLLFVIGGDGTVNEVVNALSNKGMRIAYIPGGSGNDFARGFNSLKNSNQIIQRAISEQKEATYWLCTYETKETNVRKFINCLGFGFDAVVSHSASRLSFRNVLSKLRLDSLIYLFALLRELFFYNPLHIRLTIDGKQRTFDRVLFLTINNQPYMGGGMKINPQAKNNDGHFSIIVVDSIAKWKVFLLFGTVFFGKHTSFKEVTILHGREVTITAAAHAPYQVDGEYGETKSATVKRNSEPIRLTGIK